MKRYKEEVLILYQEIKRMQCTFTFLSNVWASKAESESSRPGYSAFAYECADMYLCMASDCESEYAEVLKDKALSHQLAENSKLLLDREYYVGTHFNAKHIRKDSYLNRPHIVDCLTMTSNLTLITQ